MRFPLIDRVGQVYGRLTVMAFVERLRTPAGAPYRTWRCRCICGTETVVRGGNLGNGHTLSCGCHKLTVNITHGRTDTAEYSVWEGMIQRCHNPKDTKWPLYGARGVKVCERWRSFENFLADMGERPPETSIDRYPDNDGNYEPGNCRWATIWEQNRNLRVRPTSQSGVNGVTWSNQRQRWVAMITVRSRRIGLGRFILMDDAIAARRAAEREYWQDA